ncbi:MAG: twin-arginine translocation signal domain-containing protein, partial [Faecalibacterium prausnitzii]
MMKKISRRSFLQACSIAAATAALTACGGGKAESKTANEHEAITFMAP